MSSISCKSVVLAAVFCVVVGTSGIGCADDAAKRPPGNGADLCRQANTTAETRLQNVSNAWKATFGDLRSPARLQKFASEIASFDEKLSQGFDLFQSPGSTDTRMRAAFRRHVTDERTLVKSMSDGFAAVQKDLVAESTALLVKAGIGRDKATKGFTTFHVETAPWEKGFDPVLTKAQSLSHEDWFRFGLVTVGSDVAGDLIVDVARQVGAFEAEEGGIEDFLGRLVAGMVVEAVVDEITDPTAEFARQLDGSLANAQRQMLDEPGGFLTALRNITTHHQQTRVKLLGLNGKAGF